MGRFSKYLGEAQEVTIEYADGTKEILNLKPLNWEDVNELILVGKDFGDDPTKMLEKVSNETIERIKNIVWKTMKLSYPEEPEEEIKAFTARNFMTLIPIIMDLNFTTGRTDKLEKIRARQDAVRKISPDKKEE